MAAANVRSEITKSLNDAISDEKSVKEIIADVKEIVIKTGVSEHDVVVLVRSSLEYFRARGPGHHPSKFSDQCKQFPITEVYVRAPMHLIRHRPGFFLDIPSKTRGEKNLLRPKNPQNSRIFRTKLKIPANFSEIYVGI